MNHANVAFFIPHLGCRHRCSFCNQRSISGVQDIITPRQVSDALREAVCRMGDRVREAEIAFFGGSFTALPRRTMIDYLKAAAPFLKEGFGGIRLSTRPDAIDSEVLDILFQYGVTSVELGAQSMDDRVLSLNGRGHTAFQVKQASYLIQERGFSLGLQMMTGLYGSSLETDRDTAHQLMELKPDTVRIYPTIVVEGTYLSNLWREGRYQPQSLWEAVELCAQLMEEFETKGIRVIRVGLHAGGDVENGMLCGPWHPAFGELCENRRFLHRALDVLKDNCVPKGCVTLGVHPSDLSKMIGQKRQNVDKLRQIGYDSKVIGKTDIPKGTVQLL
ncbi:elongator complex protein 3 [Solibaculum mannosilyticum]|uniref:Radical SAM protein n=1 Tax=Solibaculum mannosilyticum TaxID=2780922 RepID=A0A7I8D0F3_9FIRM|nr:radical SAM protein [Solibaculum mannosilyticum]BCI60247.1 radical SAM protein [Solibaculum mannosilyticum]